MSFPQNRKQLRPFWNSKQWGTYRKGMIVPKVNDKKKERFIKRATLGTLDGAAKLEEKGAK